MNQRAATAPEGVTVDRLERALHVLAFIVLRHGEQYADLMEWVDDELEARRNVPSPRDRAQRILRDRMQEVRHAPAL